MIDTGRVVLDAPDLLRITMRSQVLTKMRATDMHEIARIARLTHVEEPTQLTHATSTGAAEFAASDRAGLAQPGRGSHVSSRWSVLLRPLPTHVCGTGSTVTPGCSRAYG